MYNAILHKKRTHCAILTLAFIQGQTDLNDENNIYSIISEQIQAMHIMFAVKMVRLKAYAIFVIPMTLTFTQGHNCASNVTTFQLAV